MVLVKLTRRKGAPRKLRLHVMVVVEKVGLWCQKKLLNPCRSQINLFRFLIIFPTMNLTLHLFDTDTHPTGETIITSLVHRGPDAIEYSAASKSKVFITPFDI